MSDQASGPQRGWMGNDPDDQNVPTQVRRAHDPQPAGAQPPRRPDGPMGLPPVGGPPEPSVPFAQAPAPQAPAGPPMMQVGAPGPLDGGIATLPPMDVLEPPIPLSDATGQPRRDPVMLIGMLLLYGSAAVGALSYAKFWWVAIHIKDWLGSSHLIAKTHPDTWSLAAVLWTLLITVSALIFVSAPAIAGFQAWNGYSWSRYLAAGAALLSLAAPLMINTIGWVAFGLAVLGAAVLWLPQVSRYFAHWTAFRTPAPKQPVWVENVPYGPEPRFR